MARFFKYKSTADLEAENAHLGLDLRFSDDLSVLFQPVRIGPRMVGNRWCIHPMEGCDSELDGSPGDLTFRRYQRFGVGGAKLIWGEACAVNAEGRANPRQIVLNERTKSEFAKLVEQTRQAHRDSVGDDSDMLFGLQLTHSGRYSVKPLLATRDPLLDPRTARLTADQPLVGDDELKRLVDDYVVTAKLAAEVGFDFVDVKQCHGYLLNELLGARNRPGPYSGSYENRTRLARDIFQAIKAVLPSHVLLATRMNAYDGIPYHVDQDGRGEPDSRTAALANGWGVNETDPLSPDLAEPIRWVREMHGLGVELVNITLGNPYAQPHFGRPFEYPPPDGYDSPEHPLVGVDRHFKCAEAIQRANPAVAVVGTGYSYLQDFFPQAGAANVRDGRITFVGVGRASLAQPDWVKQLLASGKLDRKRVCRTFSYCTALMREKRHPLGQYPTGCPPFDKETYGDVWKEVQGLNVKPT